MLSKEDNEALCRVGPGTPMGDLIRQYWLPALSSDELPVPDGPPLRIRPRGAPLDFGRNEEEGLPYVYHGWKFDVEGRCVDMPSEPAESNFKSKVRTTAYPCRELNGVVWPYMGPRGRRPLLPEGSEEHT